MKREDRLLQLFSKVCHIYRDELQRFIYTMTRKDRFATEEIFQNTMVEGLLRLPKLRREEKLKSWLFSIAKMEARRYYHRYQKTASMEIGGGAEVWERAESAATQDFTNTVANQELLRSLLRELTEEERQMYLLYYYYGVPLREISSILRVNYSTLRSAHTRSLCRLKALAGKKKAFL